MTITPQFSWKETNSSLRIVVDLHSNVRRDVDIVLTPLYLKVLFSPYCLELFLLHDVDATSHTERFCSGKLELILKKATEQLWAELERKLNKEDAVDERRVAVQWYNEQLQQQDVKYKENAVARERACVAAQLKLDREQEDILEEVKRVSSLSCSDAGVHGARRRVSEDREYDGDEEDHYSSTEDGTVRQHCSEGGEPSGSGRRYRRGQTSKKVASSDEEDSATQQHKPLVTSKKVMKSLRQSGATPVRATREITVSFTGRSDKLPARQSRDGHVYKERDESSGGVNTGDTDVTQLFATAKQQYDDRLFGESIKTYTQILEAIPDCVKALSNRAAAHLAQSSPSLALTDANKALAILDLKEEGSSSVTSSSRLLCLTRRGAAYSALGQFSAALTDYEAALSLQPDNAALLRDCNNIRRAMDATTTTTSEGSSFFDTDDDNESVQ